jgi:hypothetical protein
MEEPGQREIEEEAHGHGPGGVASVGAQGSAAMVAKVGIALGSKRRRPAAEHNLFPGFIEELSCKVVYIE